MLLIVDAIDEIEPEYFDDVLHFLHSCAIEFGTNVVFTFRNTHGKILHSTLNKVHKYREHDGQATLEVSQSTSIISTSL